MRFYIIFFSFQRNASLNSLLNKRVFFLLHTYADFIKEIIGEILKNLNTEEVLHDLERGSVISAYDKYRIEEYRKPYDRKNALLNLVIKRRDPALQLLVKKLPKHAKGKHKYLRKLLIDLQRRNKDKVIETCIYNGVYRQFFIYWSYFVSVVSI